MNPVITLTAQNLAALHHSAGEILAMQQDCPNEELKQIILPTPYEGAHLMLSRKELTQFHDMLERVSDEVTALSLIALFGEF